MQRLVFIIILICSLNRLAAQCPTVSITGSRCADGTDITASVSPSPFTIIWYRNNNILQQSRTFWSDTGKVVAGGQGGGFFGNQLLFPSGITLLGTDFLISDRGNNRIQRWPDGSGFASGTYAGGTGTGNLLNQLNNPGKIYLSPSGALFVVDTENDRVIRFNSPNSNGIIVAGNNGRGNGNDQLNSPEGVFVDAGNNVYVADKNNHRIMLWAAGATTGVRLFGNGIAGDSLHQLNSPRDIYGDSGNQFYIADGLNNRVIRFTSGYATGSVVAGGRGSGAAANQLNEPNDIEIDGLGNLVIADMGNHRIQMWGIGASAGVTIAGDATGAGGFSLTRLQNPAAFCFDANRNLYVVDRQNFRIMQFRFNPINLKLSIKQGGVYNAVVTSFGGCTVSSNSISVDSTPIISVTGTTTICNGASTTLTANGGSAYTWSPATGLNTTSGATVTASPSATTTYTVSSTSSNGCTGSSNITVNVVTGTGIVIGLTGPQCAGDSNLVASFSTSPSQLVWYRNNIKIRTDVSVWNDTGRIVAGGNGTGTELTKTDKPTGIAVDAAGNVYVAERENYRVTRWAPGAVIGDVVAGATGTGGGGIQVNYPVKVFIDRAGNFYVVEKNGHRVQRFTPGNPAGTIVAGNGTQGKGNNQLNSPEGVFVDASGGVYVADGGNNRIQYWAPPYTTGINLLGDTISGFQRNQFNSPRAVTVDAAGNIYVADGLNHRILQFAPGNKNAAAIYGGNGAGNRLDQLNEPNDVQVDAYGNIYIADMNNHRVVRWGSGALSGVNIAGNQFGIAGFQYNQLQNPSGIFIDEKSNLYVADRQNLRVMRFGSTPVNPTLKADAPGQYYVTASSAGGCGVNSNTVNVNGIGAITVAGNTNICLGDSTTLTARGSNNYTWTPSLGLNKTNDSIVIAKPTVNTTYTIRSAGTGTNCVAQTNVTVTVGAPLKIDITGPNCLGGDSLSVNITPPPISLLWRRGNDTLFTTSVGLSKNSVVTAGAQGKGFQLNQLDNPEGLIVYSDGSFAVTDANNYRVMRYPANSVSGTNGTILVGGQGEGSNANQLNYPTGMHRDAAGNLYVIDQRQNRVQKFAPNSTTGETVAGFGGKGTALDQLDTPSDLWVDNAGTIFISDSKNHRIVKYPAGAKTATLVAGGKGAGKNADQLNEPTGIWVDNTTGNVFIADKNNHRIMFYGPGNSVGGRILGKDTLGTDLSSFTNPNDVLFYNNAVYVTDQGNNRIMRFNYSGGFNLSTVGEVVAGNANGKAGFGANELNQPATILFDDRFNLWVVDKGNLRILRYDFQLIPMPNKISATVSGNYTVTATGTGGCTMTSAPFVVKNGTIPAPPAVTEANVCRLQSSPLINVRGTNLLWYTSETSGTGSAVQPAINTNSAGTVTLWVSQTNAAGCESPRARARVNVLSLPRATLKANSTTNLIPGTKTKLFVESNLPLLNSYRWFKNNTALFNATDSLWVQFSDIGKYQVRIKDLNTCEDTTNSLQIVMGQLDSAIALYPNPVKDIAYVYFSGKQGSTMYITVSSLNGRVYMQERVNITSSITQYPLVVRDLYPGLYIVTITNAEGRRVGSSQIIKMR